MTDETYQTAKARLLADPSVGFWLKEAIRTLDRHDCLDAARDAETLYTLLTSRVEELLYRNPAPRGPGGEKRGSDDIQRSLSTTAI